jgi:putative sterol carrier protein
MERALPPEDITPHEFFTQWVPRAVASDRSRGERLGKTDATIEFRIEGYEGEGGDVFAIRIAQGAVSAVAGEVADAHLRVSVGLETWRALNRGDTAAPQAVLSRKLKLDGDFLLGLKLHLILS